MSLYSALLLLLVLLVCSDCHWQTSKSCVLNDGGDCVAPEVVNVVVTAKSRYILNSLLPMLKRTYSLAPSTTINYFLLNTTYFREEQVKQQTSETRLTMLSDKLLFRVDPTIKFSDLFYLTMNDSVSLFNSQNKLVLVTGVLDISAYYNDHDSYHVNRSSDMFYDSSESNMMLNGLIEMLNTTDIVFVSGEAVDQSDMLIWTAPADTSINLLLLSTLTNQDWIVPKFFYSSIVLNVNVKYVPVFVTSFGELQFTNSNSSRQTLWQYHHIDHPEDVTVNIHYRNLKYGAEMLMSYPTRNNSIFTVGMVQDSVHDGALETNNVFEMKTQAVGYLYYRCDRVDREQFYDILSEKLRFTGINRESKIVPLGRCAGLLNQSAADDVAVSHDYYLSRKGDHYLAEAIRRYSSFKFVIAFENSRVPGYITEKLTNAYLAHAIPIYWGAPDVGNYFNELSMINCNKYDTLAACADRVVEVHYDDSLYFSMMSQPIMAGSNDDERQQVWSDLFNL